MKAIKLSLSILFLLIMVSIRSQDVITFKNGDEVKAKVTEVGITEIKYKKADNPNGPQYTVSKATVFMIKYENGSRDVFTAPSVSIPDMFGHYKTETKGDYNSYMHLYRKNLGGGIAMTVIGVPLIPVGLGLTIGGLATSGSTDIYGNYHNNDGGPMIATGMILLAGGIALTIVGPIKISRARQYKARAKELGPSMSFNPILAPGMYGQAMRKGAGIKINF
jgi:hypothetical protein